MAGNRLTRMTWRRVGGCQVRPRSLGACEFVCLLVLHRCPAVRIIAGVEQWTVFPNRSAAVPVRHKSLNNCFRRPRHSAPALMEDRRSPAFPHNWTHTNEPAGGKNTINSELSKCSLDVKVKLKVSFYSPSVLWFDLLFFFKLLGQ